MTIRRANPDEVGLAISVKISCDQPPLIGIRPKIHAPWIVVGRGRESRWS